ncbi:hypothetical protein [Rubinisphaera sp. JC750]|uniref:hypothetical protein n=1 Tax=Rubinisphaera sp. JC750 TaxID=2898658 RepID=UPI001F252D49|nr:hypothetical protein [Rubinisphaera sp. JC750]
MRTLLSIIYVATLSSSLAGQAFSKDPPLTTPQEAQAALKGLILEHYPDAKLNLNDRFFAAQANTMEFTVHNILCDGSIKEIPDKYQGPRHDGFTLSVSLKQGVYMGPLVLPQTLRDPYWKTRVDQIVNADRSSHLFVRYSYGSHVERTEFHRSLLAILRTTPRPLFKEDNRSLPETNKQKSGAQKVNP